MRNPADHEARIQYEHHMDTSLGRRHHLAAATGNNISAADLADTAVLCGTINSIVAAIACQADPDRAAGYDDVTVRINAVRVSS